MPDTGRRVFLSLTALSALPALWSTASRAAPTAFRINLSGASEVPANDSRGTGVAELTFDAATKTLTWNVTFSGLTGPATMAHFHGPAAPGVNAPVVIVLGGAGLTSPFGRPGETDRPATGGYARRQMVYEYPHRSPSGRRDPRPGGSAGLTLTALLRAIGALYDAAAGTDEEFGEDLADIRRTLGALSEATPASPNPASRTALGWLPAGDASRLGEVCRLARSAAGDMPWHYSYGDDGLVDRIAFADLVGAHWPIRLFASAPGADPGRATDAVPDARAPGAGAVSRAERGARFGRRAR